MHRTRDSTVLLPFFRLTQIDEERIPSCDLFRSLLNRQILNALLSFRYEIRRRLRHWCLLCRGRSP
jgi:hypothetical protein